MFPIFTNRLWNLFSRGLFFLLVICSAPAIAGQQAVFAHKNQLEMKQLIQAVLTHNPSIEAMQSAWLAAQSRIDHVSALDDPMLSYSFAPGTFDQEGQDFGQKIQLSQKLPWVGKLDLRSERARFQALAREENVTLLRLQLIETAARSFADWYYIHEALRINEINQDLWNEFQAIAELKYSTGRASKQDALRAKVEQAMLEHQGIILLRKKRNILIQMNSLLNRKPDETLPPPAALPEASPLPEPSHLQQIAIEKHPELKALLALKQASDSQVKLAEQDYYPDFNINAGYNSLWNQDEKRLTIGVGINIPLGQSKRDAKVSEKRALTQQLQWQITDKQIAIIAAVQRAYNNVEESRHVLKLYQKKLLPLSEENLQAAKADYQSGKGGFLDLVSAEKNLIQTQLNHVQAKADFYRHLAMLARRVADPSLLNDGLSTLHHSGEINKGKFK